MDVRTALNACGVDERHFAAIAAAVPEGYEALRKLADATPMLGHFMQGRRGLSYLRDVAVQYALAAKAADTRLFYTADGWNAAGNHSFLKLQVGQVIFTTHYSGANGSRSVRKAVSRAILAARTTDLFAQEEQKPDVDLGMRAAYAQVVHAGVAKPKFAVIQIPDRSQRSFKLAPLVLDLVAPSKGATEEVQDRLNEAFKRRKKDGGEQQGNVG